MRTTPTFLYNGSAISAQNTASGYALWTGTVSSIFPVFDSFGMSSTGVCSFYSTTNLFTAGRMYMITIPVVIMADAEIY